jgi:hypothetical protein
MLFERDRIHTIRFLRAKPTEHLKEAGPAGPAFTTCQTYWYYTLIICEIDYSRRRVVNYDAVVSGADPVETRPGFAAMLERIAGNGVRMIIVETANRFARLMVREVGFEMLRDLGIELVPADSPMAFLDDGPTSKLIREILGAVAGFEKAMLAAKLKSAHGARRSPASVEGARPSPRCSRRRPPWPAICTASASGSHRPARSAPPWPLPATSAKAASHMAPSRSPRCCNGRVAGRNATIAARHGDGPARPTDARRTDDP